MSTYIIAYLALLFFAASLAVADDTMHSGESQRNGRDAVVAEEAKEESVEVDATLAEPLIKALEKVEQELGKKRPTGEVSELKQ